MSILLNVNSFTMKNLNPTTPKPSRKAIFTLAHILKKDGIFPTLAECLKEAWKQSKNVAIQLITFTKKSGEQTKRVVTSKWSTFYTPNGNGRPRPKGLNLFADMAKVYKGIKNPIISTYNFVTL